MKYTDIDFGQVYREHMAAAGGREKPPEEWDARAAAMSGMPDQSSYVRAFVERMHLDGCETLLDVGCGAGAIALALAPHMKHVYALDYSQGMLDMLMRNAAEMGIGNITPILRAWEDDWSDVPVCDIATASRSTTVMDMADALAKLDAKARRHVYLTSLVGGRFMDAGIAALLNSKRPALPDYIYIVNILYGMGYHPRVDYIRGGNRFGGAATADEFAQKIEAGVGQLDDAERERLRAWYDADPERGRRGGLPFRWAFVAWDK